MGQKIKELLAANKLVKLFALGRIVHPVFVDMFGLAGGYDAVWLDQEHCALTYEQIVVASTSARANGLDCFVRMSPDGGYASVTQCLEAGAGGVMAARIESAAQAEQFVRWAKFPPRGERGMNATGRDADFTYLKPAQFAVESNRRHFTAIQIETLGALKEVDAVAAIPDVDLLFVGPTDLSMALGHVGEMGHENVWRAIEQVAAACEKHGKHWGIIAVDPAYAERAYNLGCRMLSFANDINAIRRGLEATKTHFAKFFS